MNLVIDFVIKTIGWILVLVGLGVIAKVAYMIIKFGWDLL